MNNLFLLLAFISFSYPLFDYTQMKDGYTIVKRTTEYSIIGTWKGVGELRITQNDTITEIDGIPFGDTIISHKKATIEVSFLIRFKDNSFFEIIPEKVDILKYKEIINGEKVDRKFDLKYLPKHYYDLFIKENKLDFSYFTISPSAKQNMQYITLHTESSVGNVIASSHKIKTIFLSDTKVKLEVPINNGSLYSVTLTRI